MLCVGQKIKVYGHDGCARKGKVKARYKNQYGATMLQVKFKGDPMRWSAKEYVVEARLKKPCRQPKIEVSYKIIYPDNRVFDQASPNSFSSYGIENLIQIRITKTDGKVTKREIV